jgi:hypothetical protein
MRLRIHWLRRRPRFELPRNSALRLLPAMEVRGDSNLASLSAAGGDCRVSPTFTLPAAPSAQNPGLPASCAFRLFAGDVPSRRFEGCALRRRRRNVSGLPRTAFVRYRRRPVCGSPRICVLRRQMMNRPSRPGLSTLRLRQRESPGRPESSLTSGFSDVPDASSPWRFGPSEAPTDSSSVRPDSLSFGLPSLLPRVAPAPLQRLGR